MSRDDEAWRLETEARFWLKHYRWRSGAIRQLLERLTQKRGRNAAEKLRQEMRRQWDERQKHGAKRNGRAGHSAPLG